MCWKSMSIESHARMPRMLHVRLETRVHRSTTGSVELVHRLTTVSVELVHRSSVELVHRSTTGALSSICSVVLRNLFS